MVDEGLVNASVEGDLVIDVDSKSNRTVVRSSMNEAGSMKPIKRVADFRQLLQCRQESFITLKQEVVRSVVQADAFLHQSSKAIDAVFHGVDRAWGVPNAHVVGDSSICDEPIDIALERPESPIRSRD